MKRISFNNNKSTTPTVLEHMTFMDGWRWHCMSALREMKVCKRWYSRRMMTTMIRIKRNSHLQQERVSSLADYIIGLNMKGLNQVELKLFFPWLETKFNPIQDKASREAFERILMAVVECASHNSSKRGNSWNYVLYVVCNSWCKMRVERWFDFFANELSRMRAVPCYEFSNFVLTMPSSSILFADRYIGKNRSSRPIGDALEPVVTSISNTPVRHEDG